MLTLFSKKKNSLETFLSQSRGYLNTVHLCLCFIHTVARLRRFSVSSAVSSSKLLEQNLWARYPNGRVPKSKTDYQLFWYHTQLLTMETQIIVCCLCQTDLYCLLETGLLCPPLHSLQQSTRLHVERQGLSLFSCGKN